MTVPELRYAMLCHATLLANAIQNFIRSNNGCMYVSVFIRCFFLFGFCCCYCCCSPFAVLFEHFCSCKCTLFYAKWKAKTVYWTEPPYKVKKYTQRVLCVVGYTPLGIHYTNIPLLLPQKFITLPNFCKANFRTILNLQKSNVWIVWWNFSG